MAAGTLVERLVRLGRNMILARLIAPDQFGLMAIVLAVIGLFEALTEVGVAQAVIQNKKGDTPEFLNLAWWFGVARGSPSPLSLCRWPRWWPASTTCPNWSRC